MKLYLFLIFSLISSAAIAQNSLRGHITEQTTNMPLVGATIYLPDLRQGASTNESGDFQINNLPRGTFLAQIRLVGYNSIIQNININGATTLNITLIPSTTELGAVVITGVSASTEMRRNPVPTSVVTSQDLHRHAATNIVDAISRTPGVSQITTGAAISKPVIRGLSGNRVVTLNNGIRQEGQQWGDEHGVEIDEYSVDRVEIVKGPGSIMYGSDAMAGVVNFIPANPIEEGKIIGTYSGNYQTNNRLFGNSFMNAGNINGLNWQARVSQKTAGNYQNRYDGRVYNSGFREYNANGYVGVNKSWGFSHLNFSSFNQKLGLIEGERDELGNFLKLIDHDGHTDEVPVTKDDLKGYAINDPYQTVNHLRFSSQNNFILGDSRLTFNVDWQRNLRKEFGHNHATEEEEEHDHEHHHEEEHQHGAEGASLIFDLKTLSYDIKYFLPEVHGWKTTFGSSGMQQTNVNRGIEFLIPDYKLFDAGFFGFTQKHFENLHLSGGIRFDHRNIIAETLLLDDHGAPTSNPAEVETTKFTGFKRNFSNISGSAGATYNFTNKLSGKLNIARGFRSPNIAELASNGQHEGTLRYEIGNSGLNPETSLQLDAGASLHTDHLTLDVTAFHNSIQQYIFPEKLRSVFGGDSISNPSEPVPSFKYVQGDARLYGGEISVDVHPHPLDWIHFENAFSYVRGIQLNQPTESRNLPFIPAARLQSTVRINFQPKNKAIRNWFTAVELDHTFDQNKAFTAFQTETPTSGYTLINMSAGLDISSGRNTNTNLLSIYLTANNIFDVAYQHHLSRLKYASVNPVTGRQGVFNMGRNISLKVVVPLSFRK